MGEEERNGTLDSALLVDEVDVVGVEVVNRYLGHELGKLVEFSLSFTPVVATGPAICKSFDVGQWWPSDPRLLINDFIGEVCQCKFLL